MTRYLASTLILAVASAFELHIYEGPTTCEDPIKREDYLNLHVITTIDATSATGEPDAVIDSTR